LTKRGAVRELDFPLETCAFPAPEQMATGIGERTGVIYRDENLARLREFARNSVDLIYLDPPFFSNKHYEIIWGDESEVRSFKDRWKGGVGHYIGWMRERVAEMHRVLKPNGSFYLHCDPNASHYLKVMADEIFGQERFRNEITWQRTRTHSDAKRWSPVSDTILYYSKGARPTWNAQHVAHDPAYVADKYRYEDPDGRRYRLDNMTSPSPRPNMTYVWRGHEPPKLGWRYSLETMAKLDGEGRIWYPDSKAKRPQLKRYLDEMSGPVVSDIWTDIPPVNSRARERLGYPTQKPEALMERIIGASSNRGDLVLDPFCGCGTTVTVAHKMKRKWIGIDISPTAVDIVVQRLSKLGTKVDVVGGIQRVEDLRDLEPHEFQNFVIKRVYGTHSPRKTGDMGIDGYSFLEQLPIQVKQSDRVGRNVVDNFETAIRRAGKHKGYVLAFSFTRGAFEEAARVRAEGLEIALIEISTLFEVDRDIQPRPAATQLEEDLFQAVRLAAADPARIGPAPDVSVEELVKH
jgi:DNA modification methylase